MGTVYTYKEFLDVIFDLSTGKRTPYRKPLDTPTYVNSSSCHPPSVLNQIPKSVQNRLSNLASTKDEFDLAVPPYQDALKKAGYDDVLKFEKPLPKLTKTKIDHENPFGLIPHTLHQYQQTSPKCFMTS